MNKFKKGDKVLLEATVAGEMNDCVTVVHDNLPEMVCKPWIVSPERLVRPPAVPIPALMEELELRTKADDLFAEQGGPFKRQLRSDVVELMERADELRRAREVAQEPEYKPGDEVWVRATVAKGLSGVANGVVIRGPHELDGVIHVHPDDIRKAPIGATEDE